ncbi:ATP-dependent DNA helicase MER3 [Elasticomyces elasticus]|nr:ATP-dependent DNA helicase MER3 [Elasticomyces elasticus]
MDAIFQQIDKLESGARVSTQPAYEYNDSSAEYSAYEGHDRAQDTYDGNEQYQQAEGYAPPMTFDPLNDRLRHETEHDAHHAPEDRRYALLPDNTHTVNQPRPRGFDLSRFQFGEGNQSSSSPLAQPLQSSPAFRASQQRPPAYDLGMTRRTSTQRPSRQYEEQPAYQAVSVEELEQEEQENLEPPPHRVDDFQPDYAVARPVSRSKKPSHGPPVVQGISLVSTHELPDRFRSIYPFPLFNAVQSKCFETIYKSNDNLVVSAPTGSGKTAILELAICRLITGFASGSYKIVYQAPTKSLCSERQRDWQKKFGPLDLQCAELTGDTENIQLRNVQNASIIITTPEKWDSMTRKWKDHQKLMQMVKLFLIDEVHILKEDRGAILEAVVSRMKSVGSDVRFVALSATVPNSQDIATWLGKDSTNQHVPAVRERFGEEFRPVRLQKHVVGYQSGNNNEFAFEKMLNGKLPEVIAKWSHRKPIMVFCFTRSSCVDTAKLLANWWSTKGPKDRYWSAPRQRIVVGEKDLRETISSGVAFHHAGLQPQDRLAVEKGYLEGDINVICCTSTLAVGVNLPCHMVIIKNTVTYQSGQGSGTKEYSDLEIMQMLGRAGRPQFDDSAVAVIMTRQVRVPHYEKMITGQEILESCLHRNLIDHLNAEIGLGTITNATSAKRWLSGTFLYVRLKENPDHYKLDGDTTGRNLDERLESICSNGIKALEDSDLVQSKPKLHCTEFGDAMARYYLQFETMKTILDLQPKSKISEILSAVAQASEFRDIRFRGGEKSTYKELNKNSSIKFPIPVNIDQPAHKVSLVIQAVLGGLELPSEDYKQKNEFGAAKATIFQAAQRIVRCIVDCQLYLDDAVSTRNALMLARSLGAQVWDDSPLHMRQLEGVGVVSVRKLAVAGIKCMEDIETAEAHRLEHIVSRNPPYGAQLQEKAKAFPKLRISLKIVGEPVVKKGEHVTIKVKAEIGFLNEKVPEMFQRRPVYVCLLAETSDGHKVHFARISAKKLGNGQELLFSADLTSATQTVRAYIMCDEIAGSARHALLKPEIPASAFPAPKTADEASRQRSKATNAPNTSKRRASAQMSRADNDSVSDEFGDAGLDDADLVSAEMGGFVDIDDFEGQAKKTESRQKKQKTTHNAAANEDWEPRQLPNGNWACNHSCKDKSKCKHMCCHDGLEKKPKPPKQKESKKQPADSGSDPKQTQLDLVTLKKASVPAPSTTTAQKTQQPQSRKSVDTQEVRSLNRLHDSVKSSTAKAPMLGKGREQSTRTNQRRLSLLNGHDDMDDAASSDYGIDTWDSNDLQMKDMEFENQPASRMSPPRDPPRFEPADDEMLDAQPADVDAYNGIVDLSAWTDESEPAPALHHDETGAVQPVVAPSPMISREDLLPMSNHQYNHLFVGHSTDSMENATIDESDIFGHQQPVKTISRTPSAQLRQEFEQAMAPTIDNSFLAETTHEQKTKSPDELKKWFEAEFGTELFHLTD